MKPSFTQIHLDLVEQETLIMHFQTRAYNVQADLLDAFCQRCTRRPSHRCVPTDCFLLVLRQIVRDGDSEDVNEDLDLVDVEDEVNGPFLWQMTCCSVACSSFVRCLPSNFLSHRPLSDFGTPSCDTPDVGHYLALREMLCMPRHCLSFSATCFPCCFPGHCLG